MVENARKKMGTFEEGYVPLPKAEGGNENEDEEGNEDGDGDIDGEDEAMKELAELTLPVFERMPTEEELQAAREEDPIECDDADALHAENQFHNDKTSKKKRKRSKETDEEEENNDGAARSVVKFKSSRQTLLFSATAIDEQAQKQKQSATKGNKKAKGDSQYAKLPQHMQQ